MLPYYSWMLLYPLFVDKEQQGVTFQKLQNLSHFCVEFQKYFLQKVYLWQLSE